MREYIQRDIDNGAVQRKLAWSIGISHATLQNILYNPSRKFDIETRQKVAAYYQVPLSSLLDDTMMVCEAQAPYCDPILTKIAQLFKDMTDDKKREVLKYAEKEKLLEELLKQQGNKKIS